MQLSDVWMIFVFLALTMYIVLDGYDLGIGVLTLIDRDPSRRREMQSLVAWTWDGNESWLVLLALTLWAGLPLVTGVALPALYIPLMLMLWSLVAFCQGAAFGALVAGFNVHNGEFVGGPFTFLHHGYAILTGVTAVALYV